jgi:hypothetical protein
MSQHVKHIHRDLIIADQWTEPHSPWRIPVGVLLDRTVAPDNLWFLSQNDFAHVHNQSANFQLNWKISEQVSIGGGGTIQMPYADAILF